MAWVKPTYNKEQANRAGALLARGEASGQDIANAFDILSNWRASHSFPLNTMQVYLRKAAARVDADALVVQRLKRLPSVLDKLKRFPTMNLTQMQDIGGCRAVVTTVREVKRLHKQYEKSHIKHELVNQKDYIASPKNSGYRSVHLVYRYASDKNATYNGKLIEIQIRSRLQHAWATGVEAMGTLLAHSLKSSAGPKEWLDFFTNVGTAFAEMEGTAPVPGTPCGKDLKAEIGKVAHSLEVEKKLNHVRQALQITENESSLKNSHYYLLSLDPVKDQLSITGYEKKDLDEATKTYLEAEKARAQTGIDVVLVSADSLESVRLAYPNYYLDTALFVEHLKDYLA